MKRLLTIFPLILWMSACVHAQQQGLGGTGGAGGLSGFQSSNARLVITTNSLPDAPANAAYSQTLNAVNGTLPLTWTIMLGSLPPGLTLTSSTGVISGTPTAIGFYSFTVLVTDSTSPTAQTATKQLSITVTCPKLLILTQSPLPGGTQGSSYSQTFQSSGGLGTITWTNPGGGIPQGTTLSTGGVLSGTPTTAGAYNFNITATDTCPTPQAVTKPFSLQINNTLVITTTSPLPNGTVGSPYSTQMAASGGTTPYTWAITVGTLPAGLSMNSAGLISGTPTVAVTKTVTIQVTDNVGTTNNSQFTITTACTPLSITSGPTLPNATQGSPYSDQLQSSGGAGTVTWSLISGTLDPGLTLSASGLISGTPTSPGTYTPRIQAQDSCSPTPQTAQQDFTLTVFQQLTITTSSLPAGVQGVPYTSTVSAQGGIPPYTWSVPSGPIPTNAVDMLDWMLMPQPNRTSFHMTGGLAPKYSVQNGGLIWQIKGSGGNPWDGNWYDSTYVYLGFTENNDSSQQAACQAAGYASCFVDPFSYKMSQVLKPFTPRYFVPGTTITIMTPPVLTGGGQVNPYTRTTNCGADSQPTLYLGNVKTVTSGPTVTAWGGTVGTAPTIETDYYYSGSVSGVYGNRERFYFVKGFGWINWDHASWNGTTYVVDQTSLNNTRVTGGAPTPNFGCKVPNLPTTGNLPTGNTLVSSPSLNLKDSTGAISGTPNSSGTSAFNVQVEDSAGTITQKQLSITTTCPTLTLTSTSPLPPGVINQAYSYQFMATGGVLPRAWHIIAGTLPTGLSLSTTGLLSGVPTQTGAFNITVQVLDACAPQQQSAQKPFTLNIAANSGALTITTSSPLPQGTEGQVYSQQLQATGGTPPYTWSLAAGSLPPGLTLNTAGLISGTPSTTGVSSFTARVTDAIAGTTTKVFSLTIVCPTLTITSTSPLPPGTVGQPYSFQFSSSGGIAPITWSGTGVPAGLSLSASGLLSGTPTVAATSVINVTATDSCVPTPQSVGPTGFSLTVNPAIAPVAITSTSPLADATEGKPYNNQLTANGGVPPYTWSITVGVLPPGLSLSTAGLISGTPTSAETDTPTFQVHDTLGGVDSKVLSITVVCPAFTITSTSPLPVATQNQPYSYQFTSSGGIAPITWTTTTTLPAGLTLSTSGLLSGTPTVSGTSTINITATDSCAPTAQIVTQPFVLTINPAPVPLQITTPSPLPPGTQNVPYSTTLAATGGTPPYSSWTVTAGALPTGLTLHAATGVIDGTPTVVQTTTPTIRVSDNVAATASKVFSITINPASSSNCGPPSYPCSRSDLATVQNPAVPPQVGQNTCSAGSLTSCGNTTGANTIVTDPDFSNRIVRATDSNSGCGTGASCITNASGEAGAQVWNSDSTRFTIGTTGGGIMLFSFNPATFQAAKLANLPAGNGGYGYIWSWTNPNFLYGINRSTIYKYDLTGYTGGTLPNPSVFFNYDQPGCLQADPNWTASPTVTWRSQFTSTMDDVNFASGFSNAGGQGTGFFTGIYTVGSGCRILDSKSGIIYGQWGTTGTISTPDRWTIHANDISKSGAYDLVGFTTCLSATCSNKPPYFWNIPTTNIVNPSGCLSGHWTAGHSNWMNNSGCNHIGQDTIRLFTNPTVSSNIITNFPVGMVTPFDQHFSWQNVNPTDSYAFISSSWSTVNPFPAAWYNEVLGTFPANSLGIATGTVKRFSHTFITGLSHRFNTQYAIGHVSQDGKYFIFASDWMGTLGSESGAASCTIGTDCRGDVFIVQLDGTSTPSTTAVIYPTTSVTVEQQASEPFSAWVNGGSGTQTGTWSVTSGTGTISSKGVFTAPSTNESDTIQFTCTGGVTCSQTKTITISGTIPSYSCAWTQGSGAGGDSTCTMTHDTVTRSFLAHVPPNYVAGQSGLWIALSGGDVSGSTFCVNAGLETQGPARYVDSLASPAPIVICPNPLQVPAGHPQWHSLDLDADVCTRTWTPNVCPDDSDYIRQIILAAKKDKNIDLKKVMVFGLWNVGSSMAQRVALEQGDLIATVGVEWMNWRNPFSTNPNNGPPSVPASNFPVSVIGMLTTANNLSLLTICGVSNGTNNFTYNEDDEFAYWTTADSITTFDTPNLFCGGQGGTNYTYTSGTTYVNKWANAGSLPEKDGTGGILNTEVRIWALKGGTNQMYCSPNTGCSPVIHFIGGACNTGNPCNSAMTSATGDTVDDLLFNFWNAHAKP